MFVIDAVADNAVDSFVLCGHGCVLVFDDICGVEQLAPAVNRICGLTALIAQEHAKISALGDYMNAWQEGLRLTLDRVYQAQREDMLTVYTRAQQVLQDAAARPDNSGE